jgi:hypothetical protein
MRRHDTLPRCKLSAAQTSGLDPEEVTAATMPIAQAGEFVQGISRSLSLSPKCERPSPRPPRARSGRHRIVGDGGVEFSFLPRNRRQRPAATKGIGLPLQPFCNRIRGGLQPICIRAAAEQPAKHSPGVPSALFAFPSPLFAHIRRI